MGSKGLLFSVVLFFSSNVLGADLVRIPCDDHMWRVTMPALQLDEPALRSAYDKMVNLSLSSLPTNCSVVYPAENGTPINGTRTVVMDKQWQVIRYINGRETRVFQQHGIKMEYELIYPQPNVERRTVTWFSVCRTPESCERLGIPFERP